MFFLAEREKGKINEYKIKCIGIKKKYIRMYMNHVSGQNKDRGATFSSYVKMMVSSESLYTLY